MTRFIDKLVRFYAEGMSFFDLETKMYPPGTTPSYYRRGCNGGPPGGRWSLVANLKRHGLRVDHSSGRDRRVYGIILDPKYPAKKKGKHSSLPEGSK